MEGSSLPVLGAPQTLTAAGVPAPAAAADPAAADGFAAILGATELTGLTADQQMALGQLLENPVRALQPVIDLGGKALPPAAIRGLLHVLGVDVDVPDVENDRGLADADLAPTGAVDLPGVGMDVARWLAALWPAAAAAAPQPPQPAQAPTTCSPDSSEDGGASDPMSLAPLLQIAARAGFVGAEAGADVAEQVASATQPWPSVSLLELFMDAMRLSRPTGNSEAPAEAGIAVDTTLPLSTSGKDGGPAPALSPVLIAPVVLGAARNAPGRSDVDRFAETQRPLAPGVPQQRGDPAEATIDSANLDAARPGALRGAQAPPAAHAAAAAAETPARDSPLSAASLAAVEFPTDELHCETSLVADLTRAVASTSDATALTHGRSVLAAVAELVPPRMARVASEPVSIPVGERGWERAFGERVVWLVGQQIQAAEVRLNPPHLGPVEVRLSLTGQDASVSFTVSHGATRDAIEQAIPRLRELFAEHQLQVVNVDVGQRDAASQASQGDRWSGAGRSSAGSEAAAGEMQPEPAARSRQRGRPGLVDEYV